MAPFRWNTLRVFTSKASPHFVAARDDNNFSNSLGKSPSTIPLVLTPIRKEENQNKSATQHNKTRNKEKETSIDQYRWYQFSPIVQSKFYRYYLLSRNFWLEMNIITTAVKQKKINATNKQN